MLQDKPESIVREIKKTSKNKFFKVSMCWHQRLLYLLYDRRISYLPQNRFHATTIWLVLKPLNAVMHSKNSLKLQHNKNSPPICVINCYGRLEVTWIFFKNICLYIHKWTWQYIHQCCTIAYLRSYAEINVIHS